MPTDDIVDDVGVVRKLVGEYPKSSSGVGTNSTKDFVAEVEDALTLEPLACIAPPWRIQLMGQCQPKMRAYMYV